MLSSLSHLFIIQLIITCSSHSTTVFHETMSQSLSASPCDKVILLFSMKEINISDGSSSGNSDIP